MTSLATTTVNTGAGGASVGRSSGSSTAVTASSEVPQLAEYWRDDFAPLQNAGKAILQVLRKDEASPHGDLYRRILSTSSSASSLSPTTGQPDTAPNHHYFVDGKWTHSQSVPLPPFLQEQLSKAKICTLMGLFPEANMAWMTIDETIYLWSYKSDGSLTSEREFLYFKVPSSQPIISAGLARPKAGVFTQSVEWCLVVTTKEEAMLCALARKSHHALAAVLTNFVIPSDWVSFVSVASTESGRIFLGGQDGHLYELDYDLLVEAQTNTFPHNTQSQLDNFYDGNTGLCPAQMTESKAHTTTMLTKGKRAFDALINQSGQPPRKCRKLDHSRSTFSSYIPEVFNKFTSAILGDSTTKGGGAIIQMVVDEERQVLYTLSTRGWICALDIAENPKITLSAVLDTPATARLYLEAVSRGRMYAPPTTSTREGHLAFPGGGEAAQAGVGGMEGARRILKMAEQTTTNRRQKVATTSLLTPVAIEVVPMRESTRITLVAITSGGLRFYLSSLNPNSLGAGPASQAFSTPRHRQSTKPHSKMTLCHIRSPPSFQESVLSSSSHAPTQPVDQRVDAACYRLGVFFAAFHKNNPVMNRKTTVGNVLVTASMDSKARAWQESKRDESAATMIYLTPGGICESVSFPLSSNGEAISAQAILPGGRVWDICVATCTQSKVLTLALRSKTPTDAELSFAIAPAYVPPHKRLSGKKINTNKTGIVSSTSGQATHTVSSLAITVITNLLLSRPARHGIELQQPKLSVQKSPPMYRVSKRSGVDGFSLSAADSKASAGVASTRSARLSPWLLTPEIVPLNPTTLQYFERPSAAFLALNAGGLHEFRSPSIIEQLASAILKAGCNVRSDPNVSRFFEAFGYGEGCSMCLILAMRSSSSNDLKEFAMLAALSRAYRPTVSPILSNGQDSTDTWVPSGYTFTSSALYDGLTLAVARLLRPFWYKPAVVVTEGRVLKREYKTLMTPAKVELLLDDEVLHDLRSPLTAMQRVISRVFSKAIENVPLSKRNSASTDQMDIDDDKHFLTRAIEYQRRGQVHVNSNVMRASEADELAQHIEERNIHSLYRLVSRTAQLLSLLSHLRRAHCMPDLPEVDWGQLHGVSIAHLIQSRDGQERVESTLHSLVTSLSVYNSSPTVSADAKQLAEVLSEECYHFFSPGSRFAYFGFQSAHDALATSLDQKSRRKALALEAVECLKNAAREWHNPSLVTGHLLQSQDFESYDKISESALQCDSLLAKACVLLADLEHVAALVEICLLTASNFGFTEKHETDMIYWNKDADSYHWEKGLYHRRQSVSQTGSGASSAHAIVSVVTAQDAVKTCHALIFHHLSRLLDSSLNTVKYELGEKMVSVCAASQDVEFLHKFFSRLIERNHTDVLLRINSPALEAWLAEWKGGNLELLLRYYQIHEMNIEAGEVASIHASTMNFDLELHERMEFLVYSVDSFARAKTQGQGDQNQTQLKLKQCEERLRIARLQGRILQTISSTKYELSSEALNPLQFRLLTANELLNRYAIPYDMFEYCLLLLHACKHKDMLHIEQFWKSLLCEEILPCATRNERVYRSLCSFMDGSLIENPTIQLLDENTEASESLFEDGSWMNALEETVVRVGSEVYGSDESYSFPIEFVTSCIEELRLAYSDARGEAEGRRTRGWTFRVLVSAGVDHLVALRAYEQMIERENHSTMGIDPRRRLQQIQCAISMLESCDSRNMAGDPMTSISSGDETHHAQTIANALLSSIDEYRSKLQCLPVDISAEENRLLSLETKLKQPYR